MSATKAASLADNLVERFEAEIHAGNMPPGSRFPTEKSITLDFGVSRPVVREAFARLAARGLLESRRGSGAYVADDARYRAFQVTAAEVAEIDDVLRLLEMRIGFEVEMANLAAQRRTEEDLDRIRASLVAMENSYNVDDSVAADAAFHAGIAQATGNSYYVRFTDFLGIRMIPSRKLYLQHSSPEMHQQFARMINADHEAIFAAIVAKDAPRARRAARRHMTKSVERYDRIRSKQDNQD